MWQCARPWRKVLRTPIRTILVDDYAPWRGFLRCTLRAHEEFEAIAECSDGPEAIQKAQELQPDLILLDIGLPTLNGIEAARHIREVSPGSKILFVSQNRSPEIVEEGLSTGAEGYVVKSDAARDLFPAIKAIFEGKRFISASLAGHFLVAEVCQFFRVNGRVLFLGLGMGARGKGQRLFPRSAM